MARKTKKNNIAGKVTDICVEAFTGMSSHLYLKVRIDQCRTVNAEAQLHTQLDELTEKFVGKEVQVYVQ